MKKFNQWAKKKKKKKKKILKIFLSSIKTKVAMKFPKKKNFIFSADNWLGSERVEGLILQKAKTTEKPEVAKFSNPRVFFQVRSGQVRSGQVRLG